MKSLKGTLTIKGRLRGILYAPTSAEGMTLQEKTVTYNGRYHRPPGWSEYGTYESHSKKDSV